MLFLSIKQKPVLFASYTPLTCGRALLCKGKPLAEDVDATILARNTPGFSGAQLALLANEAALFAAQTNASCLTAHMLDAAFDKIHMGVMRK